MGAHLNSEGQFQSDKYPSTPAGKVPLSVEDPTAHDLLWEYAQRRRAVDAGFAADLETALRRAGYAPAAKCEYDECDRDATGPAAQDAGGEVRQYCDDHAKIIAGNLDFVIVCPNCACRFGERE